jgi:hypothetical protein
VPTRSTVSDSTEAKPMHPRPPVETKTSHERDHRRRPPGCPPRGVRVGPPGPSGSYRGPGSQGHACRARGGRQAPGADRQHPRLLERRRPSSSVTRTSSLPTRTALLRTCGRAVGAHGSRQIRVRAGDVPPGGVARGRAEVLRWDCDAVTGAARRCWRRPTAGDRQPGQASWISAQASTGVDGSRLKWVRCPASDGSSPPSIRVRLWR